MIARSPRREITVASNVSAGRPRSGRTVHKNVRSGLYLGYVRPVAGNVKSASSAGADNLRRQPGRTQSFNVTAERGQRLTRRRDSLVTVREQHRVAFVAHHSAILQARLLCGPRQIDGLFGRFGTAAMHSCIDFDYHVGRAP